MGRFGVPRSNRRDSRQSAVRGGLHAASFVACQESFRSTSKNESYQIVRAFSRRACLPRSQAHLWFCKSSLSWPCEKRASVGRQLRTLESALESKTLAAGVVRPKVDQAAR